MNYLSFDAVKIFNFTDPTFLFRELHILSQDRTLATMPLEIAFQMRANISVLTKLWWKTEKRFCLTARFQRTLLFWLRRSREILQLKFFEYSSCFDDIQNKAPTMLLKVPFQMPSNIILRSRSRIFCDTCKKLTVQYKNLLIRETRLFWLRGFNIGLYDQSQEVNWNENNQVRNEDKERRILLRAAHF